MLNVKGVDEVFQIIKQNFSGYKLEHEFVRIEEALGRIIAVDIRASEDIPGFNRSAVDGYAVISSDIFGASDFSPVQLRLIGEVKIGKTSNFTLQCGQTAYVPTGGELPQNADAVVMIENVENFDDGFIYVNKAVASGNHLVFKGDDIRKGHLVIRANSRLKPRHIGVLAAMGYTQVPVKRRVIAGIISTGDEIIEIDKQPVEAQVRDVNTYTLHAVLVSCGAQTRLFGIVKDDYHTIRRIAKEALMHCDVVLVSGGSSAGIKDETYRVIDSLGSPGVLIHGIAVKPGKPTIIGKVNDKAVIGLPGHPVSAYIIAKIFVNYLLRVINGEQEEYKPVIRAEMAYNYPSNNGREEILPVRLKKVKEKIYVHPVFGKSGLISMLTMASGYIHIPRNSEGINKGAEVEVYLF